ncbi:MAG TPA: acyltransferase [Mycobacteriales bacterium]
MTLVAERQPRQPRRPQEAPALPPVRGHLPQIDVVRVLAFGAVIGVHALSTTVLPTDPVGGGVLMLLHFTREAFFLITGVVLVHTYGSRAHFDVPAFWRRRFLLVGVPYLAWSLVYYLVNVPFAPSHGQWWRTFGFDLLTGRASYQLYFLLVSLQAYLLLPLIFRLLRKTAGHHLLLLAVSAALQLVTFRLIQGTRGATGWALTVLNHTDAMFPTYQFFLLAGAVFAWHLPRMQALLHRHLRWVPWIVLGGVAIAELAFALQVGPYGAVSARGQLQMAMVPWGLASFVGLYALGVIWASQRRTGRWATALDVGQRISFGVYLVHPLVLDLLFAHGFAAGPGQIMPSWLATIVAVAIALTGAVIVVLLVQQTPLSSMLTGREYAGRWRWRPVIAAVVVTAGLATWAGVVQQAPQAPPPITTD